MSPRGGRAAHGTAPATGWWHELLGQGTGLFAVVFLAYAAGAVLSWEAFGSMVGPAF